MKTPLALFGLIALAGLYAASAAGGRPEWREGASTSGRPLLSLFVVYWLFIADERPQHRPPPHHPRLPGPFVMAAGAAAWVARPLRWTARSSRPSPCGSRPSPLWIRPHYLAYFNEIVGPRGRVEARRRQLARLGPGPPDAEGVAGRASPGRAPSSSPTSAPGDTALLRHQRDAHRRRELRPAPAQGPGHPDRRPLDHQRHPVPAGLHGGARAAGTGEGGDATAGCSPTCSSSRTADGKLTYKEGVEVRGIPVRPALPRTCAGRKPIAELAYTFLVFRLTDAEVLQALYGPVAFP